MGEISDYMAKWNLPNNTVQGGGGQRRGREKRMRGREGRGWKEERREQKCEEKREEAATEHP